jgi:long-subunit acyl-CoA synthetase (AMP-forming)
LDILDEEILKQKPSKTDVAVIMYTSGSTGTPKGKSFFFFTVCLKEIYRGIFRIVILFE